MSAVPYMFLDLTGPGNLLGLLYWEILSPWRGAAWMLNTGGERAPAALICEPTEPAGEIAQRRKRVFLVADFAGLTAPQILFEPESLPGYPAEGEEARQEAAAHAGEGVEAPGGDRPADDY